MSLNDLLSSSDHKLNTAGFYHYLHCGIDRYGDGIEILIIFICNKNEFAEMEEGRYHPEDPEYYAYIGLQINNRVPDLNVIRNMYNMINAPEGIDLFTTIPDSFYSILCDVDKDLVTFQHGTLLKNACVGTKNIYRGSIKKDRLTLDWTIVGFDAMNNIVEEQIFKEASFQFTSLLNSP